MNRFPKQKNRNTEKNYGLIVLRSMIRIICYILSVIKVGSKIKAHSYAVFKSVFSNIKSGDEHIKFAFFTGVTKFTKVSIFSELNNLKDISLTERYA